MRREDIAGQLATTQRPAGPYSIGSDHWPGLSKVMEEAGELLQVLGKIMGAGGDAGSHWDGTDLTERLVNELGDLHAALEFFEARNRLSAERIAVRATHKRALFDTWHDNGQHPLAVARAIRRCGE